MENRQSHHLLGVLRDLFDGEFIDEVIENEISNFS